MNSAAYWIKTLNLLPHPEGGYYRETYRSSEIIQPHHFPGRFDGPRVVSTAIYFLLEGNQISALHRIKCDEAWHFYQGDSIRLSVIAPDGKLVTHRLGADPEIGEAFQVVIPAGCWFGASLDNPDSFALVGCTVAPGFDFHDFELGNRDQLIRQYPQHKNIITRLMK